MTIKFYKSIPPYGYMNNFCKAKMTIYGKVWETVEHAYQAQKTLIPGEVNKTAYLFLADVAFGNQKIVAGSSMYTKKNIKPNHSVWAKSGGGSGLYNDELITYTQTGPEQQHKIRYIIEFETMAK